MSLSVTAPIEEALSRTGRLLFKPFEASKWFKLGFCAFLVQLGDCSGGSGGSSFDGSDVAGGNARRNLHRAGDWLGDNLPVVLTAGLLVLLVVAAIWITFLWLQARGRFMFLDGVVKNRGAVVEPWHEYRSEGNSLFRFAVVVSVLGFLLSIVALAIGLALAWSDIDRGRFEGSAVAGLIVGGGMLFTTVVVFGLINLFLNDFVVPAMYKRRIGVMQAWSVAADEILRPHAGTAVLYVLIKIVIAIVMALITLTVMCGTLGLMCCFIAIPYIGTVILLPLLVFDRCFSVAFLEQLGGSWLLGPAPDEPAPSAS